MQKCAVDEIVLKRPIPILDIYPKDVKDDIETFDVYYRANEKVFVGILNHLTTMDEWYFDKTNIFSSIEGAVYSEYKKINR